MSFAENLQYLRKKENITQEQFAERLEVSRQSVSKWESGSSYPEMDKLLQICEMFHCSMDVLMQGDAQKVYAQDDCGYDKHKNHLSRLYTGGVGIILLGASVFLFLEGGGLADELSTMIFLIIAVFGIMALIIAGLQENEFTRKHPYIKDFYTEEQRDRLHQRSILYIVSGVGAILAGLIWTLGCEAIPLPAGYDDDIFYGIFLLFVDLGVMLFIWTGTQKSKLDIETYNREANPDALPPEEKKKRRIANMLYGSIMILATIAFFLMGMIWTLWEISWIAFPVGGLLCGIVYLVLAARG